MSQRTEEFQKKTVKSASPNKISVSEENERACHFFRWWPRSQKKPNVKGFDWLNKSSCGLDMKYPKQAHGMSLRSPAEHYLKCCGTLKGRGLSGGSGWVEAGPWGFSSPASLPTQSLLFENTHNLTICLMLLSRCPYCSRRPPPPHTTWWTVSLGTENQNNPLLI